MQAGTRLLSLAGTVVVAVTLAGCSGAGEDDAMEASEGAAGDSAMVALCDEMVAAGMSPEEATALAESEGFSARIGSIDGQLQPTTRDYRPDRFTFEVVDGAVVSCQYG